MGMWSNAHGEVQALWLALLPVSTVADYRIIVFAHEVCWLCFMCKLVTFSLSSVDGIGIAVHTACVLDDMNELWTYEAI